MQMKAKMKTGKKVIIITGAILLCIALAAVIAYNSTFSFRFDGAEYVHINNHNGVAITVVTYMADNWIKPPKCITYMIINWKWDNQIKIKVSDDYYRYSDVKVFNTEAGNGYQILFDESHRAIIWKQNNQTAPYGHRLESYNSNNHKWEVYPVGYFFD